MASTPDDLFAAIDADDVVAVRAIVAADPSLARSRDEHGVSALLRARYRGRRELVEAVAPYAGELDVFESAALGDVGRLRELLHERAAVVGDRSGDGFTPLHLAAFFGRAESADLLLSFGADPNAAGTGWMRGTPLHSAASGRHRDVAGSLLRAGADPNARQSGGWTPLHSAANNGDAELARLLLQADADPEARNDEGRSVLDLARENGDAETIRAIEAALGG
jgi:uncharacterized protein